MTDVFYHAIGAVIGGFLGLGLGVAILCVMDQSLWYLVVRPWVNAVLNRAIEFLARPFLKA